MPNQLVLNKPRIDSRGCLIVSGYATRVGVFDYYIDGKIQGVYRSAEEVFKDDSIKGLTGAAITVEHPENFINAKDFKGDGVVGLVLDAKPSGNFIKVEDLFYDAQAVSKAIADGYTELSCGYNARLVESKGTYEGKDYAYEQKDITYNHVSLVKEGRAGKDVRLYLDSKEILVSNISSVSTLDNKITKFIADMKENHVIESSSNPIDKDMFDIVIDGLTYKTEDANLVKSVNGLIQRAKDLEKGHQDTSKLQELKDSAIATEAKLTLENSELKTKVDALMQDMKSKDSNLEESIRTWLMVLPELGDKHLDAGIPLNQVKRDYIQRKMPDLRKDISDELVAELFTLVQAKDSKEASISPVEKLMQTSTVRTEDTAVAAPLGDRIAAKRAERLKGVG